MRNARVGACGILDATRPPDHKTMKRIVFLAAVVMAGLRPGLAADFKFASVISDHAVLQREVEAPVWGFAETGAVVRVSLFKEGDKNPLAVREATTDDAGRWTVKLPAMPAGGPYRITARLSTASTSSTPKSTSEIAISDVLFGVEEVEAVERRAVMRYGPPAGIAGSFTVQRPASSVVASRTARGFLSPSLKSETRTTAPVSAKPHTGASTSRWRTAWSEITDANLKSAARPGRSPAITTAARKTMRFMVLWSGGLVASSMPQAPTRALRKSVRGIVILRRTCAASPRDGVASCGRFR